MRSQAASQRLTLDIGSLFSVGGGRGRSNPITWLNDGPGTYEPLFTLSSPLEVVGVKATKPSIPTTPWGVPSVSVAFAPSGKVAVEGPVPDDYVRQAFRASGRMITSVDTLSRSIQLIDLDPLAVVNSIRTQNDSEPDNRGALEYAVHAWRFDSLDEPAANQARELLIDNVRQHERAHVTHSINPQTALWKNLELHYRWLLLTADPSIWSDQGFVGRFTARYGTPSKYITELLAILSEDYTTADSAVRRAVETRVAAHQGGAVGHLLECFRQHEIDDDTLFETLYSPLGEQYCDLWLVYVIDELRKGHSLSDIDPEMFLQTCDAAATTNDISDIDAETRTELVTLLEEVCLGPVVEVVRLTDIDGTITLERTWCSMIPNTPPSEKLLAVRRALFRRCFFHMFRTATELNEVLEGREAAVEDVIRGASLADVALYDDAFPPTQYLAAQGQPAHEMAREALLGEQATTADLDAWLNDPDYGYSSHRNNS